MGDSIQFETANFRWTVTLDRRDHRTTASITGVKNDRQPMPAGTSVPKGTVQNLTLEGSDQDELFDRIRALIVQQDGPITKGDPGE